MLGLCMEIKGKIKQFNRVPGENVEKNTKEAAVRQADELRVGLQRTPTI